MKNFASGGAAPRTPLQFATLVAPSVAVSRRGHLDHTYLPCGPLCYWVERAAC